MNEIELTEMFVEYRKTKEKLDILEKAIQDAVLEIGDSQKVAGVKATYYKPSIRVDYEGAALQAGATQDMIDEFSTIKKITRWKEVAEVLKADLTWYSTTEPAHVVVKV